MSATEVHGTSRDTAGGSVRVNLEVQIIPVSDADRSKQFYERRGWRLDDDVSPLPGLRIVQLAPPGSAASITFGQGLTAPAPGSAEGDRYPTSLSFPALTGLSRGQPRARTPTLWIR